MTSEKAPERIIAGAKEAVAIAAGEKPAHRLHINGHTYVPADLVAAKDAEIERLRAMLEDAASAVEWGARRLESTGQRCLMEKWATEYRAALSREGEA